MQIRRKNGKCSLEIQNGVWYNGQQNPAFGTGTVMTICNDEGCITDLIVRDEPPGRILSLFIECDDERTKKCDRHAFPRKIWMTTLKRIHLCAPTARCASSTII